MIDCFAVFSSPPLHRSLVQLQKSQTLIADRFLARSMYKLVLPIINIPAPLSQNYPVAPL